MTKILFLEDSDTFADTFLEAVEPFFEVEWVQTFKEYQRACASSTEYHMIVSDVHVPFFGGEDARNWGYEVLYEGQKYLGPELPIIFITSDLESEFILEVEKEVPCFDKRDMESWLSEIQTTEVDSNVLS